GCAGKSCNILGSDPCDAGCFCLPVGIVAGVCV
uniref:Inhibitor cystine knot peptide MCh-1 n=1 Tax=Momordica charantia TaxID=3673 RepID=V5IRT8_MOMCH|nr:Chain A, Inhibitor cystine knot peptide MCh-1 [Momordica charantia]